MLLNFSKIIYPETATKDYVQGEQVKLEKSQDRKRAWVGVMTPYI